jgi:hypothetical protein
MRSGTFTILTLYIGSFVQDADLHVTAAETVSLTIISACGAPDDGAAQKSPTSPAP